MTPRTAAIGIGVLTLAAFGLLAWILKAAGSSAPVWIGLFTGVGLGGVNLLFESLSLTWALKKRPSAIMLISLGGFGLRLVIVCVLTLVFAKAESIDAATFALSYVGSFLAYVILQVWVVSRMQGNPDAGGGRAETEGE